MEQELKQLHAEKEAEHLQAVHAHVSSKLAETRRKRVQELERKIAELTRKCMEQNKIIKGKEKQDQSEIQSLKETRVKLIRQMRNDANNFTKWKQSKEKEINKLRTQDRKRAYEMVRMRIEHDKQENVFKRKMEEAFAVNKRLKGALEMQRKAMQRQERKANSKEEIKTWMYVAQELEVLMATVETNYSLEKLMQDRASLVHQLEQLKKNSDPDEEELMNITEFIELRNAQIADLQQKVLKSDQETRTRARWNIIRTIADAKAAFETAFHKITQNKKQQYYKHDELKEKYRDLEARLEEYEKRDRVNKMSRPRDTSDTSSSDIETLTKSERQISTENKLNTNERSPSKKKKRKSKIEVINEIISILSRAYLSHDDSSMMEDDVDKDPDWKKTPLYSSIQKLQRLQKLQEQEETECSLAEQRHREQEAEKRREAVARAQQAAAEALKQKNQLLAAQAKHKQQANNKHQNSPVNYVLDSEPDGDESDDESRPKPHKTFKCPQCSQTFTDRSNKNRHIRTVHNPQKVQCEHCTGEKSFLRRDDLKKHIKKKHPEKIAK